MIAGEQTNKTTTITLPVSGKPYVPNALEAVKKRAAIQGKFNAEAAAREFVTLTNDEQKQPKR